MYLRILVIPPPALLFQTVIGKTIKKFGPTKFSQKGSATADNKKHKQIMFEIK